MTEQELDTLLAAFEAGTLPKERWTHAAHLMVAACYAEAFPEAEALDRMRAGVIHYNESVGTLNTPSSGYHETLTRFWMVLVGRFLAARDGGRAERVEALVAEYGPRRDVFKEYWSFDLVKSSEARAVWVAPDLKPI